MLDELTTPTELEGEVLGPVTVALTPDRIAFYADATGEEQSRWVDQAPPGFASVLLFSVADLFLYHPRVVPFTATLLHLDQAFAYPQPMRSGTAVTMEGTITRVRQRGSSFFVTFDATGTDERGVVLESSSTFVLSDQRAAPPQTTIDEPPVRERGANSDVRRSASRHDLVRYAAATRDFNPLHWDHETAVDAGLPGTVVHGLLMYAWLVQAATEVSGAPVSSAKVRFRSALHPAEQAEVVARVDDDVVTIELVRNGTQLVTGTATVAVPTREGEPG